MKIGQKSYHEAQNKKVHQFKYYDLFVHDLHNTSLHIHFPMQVAKNCQKSEEI